MNSSQWFLFLAQPSGMTRKVKNVSWLMLEGRGINLDPTKKKHAHSPLSLLSLSEWKKNDIQRAAATTNKKKRENRDRSSDSPSKKRETWPPIIPLVTLLLIICSIRYVNFVPRMLFMCVCRQVESSISCRTIERRKVGLNQPR